MRWTDWPLNAVLLIVALFALDMALWWWGEALERRRRRP